MHKGEIIARLLLGYWVVVGIINLFFIRGFGIDGLAELTVLVAVGIVFWAITSFITRKASQLAAASRRKYRRRERFTWR